jgi:hypothetical protein
MNLSTLQKNNLLLAKTPKAGEKKIFGTCQYLAKEQILLFALKTEKSEK